MPEPITVRAFFMSVKLLSMRPMGYDKSMVRRSNTGDFVIAFGKLFSPVLSDKPIEFKETSKKLWRS